MTDARAKLQSLAFDLIVLDLMMPGENGLDFAEAFRKNSSVPILMLTAMGEAEDRIVGLEKGADDYLTKPFEPRELLLRIHNILRRSTDGRGAEEETFPIRLGDFIFNPGRGELAKGGEPVRLTEKAVCRWVTRTGVI